MVTFFDLVPLRGGVINLEINWYVFIVCQQEKNITEQGHVVLIEKLIVLSGRCLIPSDSAAEKNIISFAVVWRVNYNRDIVRVGVVGAFAPNAF